MKVPNTHGRFCPPSTTRLNSCCPVENGWIMRLCLYYTVVRVRFITSWVLDQDFLLPLPIWLPVRILYLNMCFTMFSFTWRVQTADLPCSIFHTNFRCTVLFQTSCIKPSLRTITLFGSPQVLIWRIRCSPYEFSPLCPRWILQYGFLAD